MNSLKSSTGISSRSDLALFAWIVFLTCLCEVTVMVILLVLGTRGAVEIILDPLILACFITPLMYSLIIRPLGEAAERHRAIFESALDAIVACDAMGTVRLWNPAAETIFGYAAEEAIGKSVLDLVVPPQHREAMRKGLAGFARNGRGKALGRSLELTAQREDGSEFPVDLSMSAYRDRRGFMGVALVRDITQRRHVEGQLRKLSLAVEQSPATVVITDTQARIEYVNPRFVETTGYTAEEAIGQNPRLLKSGHQPEGEYKRMWETLTSGKTWRGEFHNKRKNGEFYWEAASISPITNSAGEVTHYVAVKEEITERKQAQQQLEQYTVALESQRQDLEQFYRAAENATQAKSEFLANMSHEIRTPMTAILGFTDLLLDNLTEPKDIEAANTIKRNGDYLVGLINNILDLSKIEAGKLEVESAVCSPVKLLTDVLSLMQVRVRAKNLSLEVEYEGPIPASIRTDPTRLRQILINLVGNALKFTEVGGVRLVTRLLAADGQEPRLQFEVIDTGIGMTEEQSSRILQPFTQADASTSRRFGGTGLGLTISEGLAKMLGGGVSFTSIPGKGSTFRLTVATGPLEGVPMLSPQEETAAEVGPKTRPPAGADARLDCRVLLVEDGPDNQRLIAHILRKAGADVTLAENGQEGLEEALAESAGRGKRDREPSVPFDVILMDIQMPVMDGYEATRRLREEGYTQPIIALTAHAMTDDRQRCLDAGCDDFMTKPIERDRLLLMVTKHVNGEARLGLVKE